MISMKELSFALVLFMHFVHAVPVVNLVNMTDTELCASIKNGTNVAFSMEEAEKCNYTHDDLGAGCPSVECDNSLLCSNGYLLDAEGCETCDCIEWARDMEIDIAGNFDDIDLWEDYTDDLGEFIIPYETSEYLSSAEKKEITQAIDEINDNTCLQFLPRKSNDSKEHYIRFEWDEVCSSAVGKTGGAQEVILSQECSTKGGVLHELMHTLGFLHEHNRPDRDQYINIEWENIIPEKRSRFNKWQVTEGGVLNDFPYDVTSVTHYDSFAFSNNGEPTITGLDGFPLPTQNTNLSVLDIDKINHVYGCPEFMPLPPMMPDKCKDDLFACPELAYTCACLLSPAFMMKHCCSSCEMEATQIVDQFPFCNLWESNCGKSTYFDNLCRKTCPKCVLAG
ncbi:zinc metalloproteinase nas-6-like [Ciona intestinalis]